MKSIIVYYSLEGNTDYAARQMAQKTGADLLRLVPTKAYPSSGFRKFLWGGASVLMSEKPKLEPYEFDADAYDLVILGFPVWASNMAPPLRTFVTQNDLSKKRVAAFACQSGSGAQKAFAKLMACVGTDELVAELVLIDPKDKPNAGNERLIDEFCAKLNG